MLSHKLSNLLKLYKTASRVENLNTISHCSNEFAKVLGKIDGQSVDPVAQLYLDNLDTIHSECHDIVKRKLNEMESDISDPKMFEMRSKASQLAQAMAR